MYSAHIESFGEIATRSIGYSRVFLQQRLPAQCLIRLAMPPNSDIEFFVQPPPETKANSNGNHRTAGRQQLALARIDIQLRAELRVGDGDQRLGALPDRLAVPVCYPVLRDQIGRAS